MRTYAGLSALLVLSVAACAPSSGSQAAPGEDGARASSAAQMSIPQGRRTRRRGWRRRPGTASGPWSARAARTACAPGSSIRSAATRRPSSSWCTRSSGVSHWIRAVADQLAADGFIAIAPDFLTGLDVPSAERPAHGGQRPAAIQRVSQADVQRRIDAVARWGMALPAAPCRATASWATAGADRSRSTTRCTRRRWGRPSSTTARRRRRTRLGSVRAPVLGLYGENDARVNATIARGRQRHAGAGQDVRARDLSRARATASCASRTGRTAPTWPPRRPPGRARSRSSASTWSGSGGGGAGIVRSAPVGSAQAPSGRAPLAHLPRNCRGRLGVGHGSGCFGRDWCGMVGRPPPRPSPANCAGEGGEGDAPSERDR